MFAFVENIDLAAFQTLLARLPESVGLLAFGIVLTAIAVSLRKVLDRNAGERVSEKLGKKV
jgi:uncharacterized membrane protein YidH (DUF202 family)